jgi:DNA-binding HxlR family transcriptional regulator
MAHATPLPGQPVRGSTTGQPVMALFDLLGRAWAMGIVWQLGQGALTFRQLRQACEGVSPSLLNRRLKELRVAQLVEGGPDGYQLTLLGSDVLGLLRPLGALADRWAVELGS